MEKASVTLGCKVNHNHKEAIIFPSTHPFLEHPHGVVLEECLKEVKMIFSRNYI